MKGFVTKTPIKADKNGQVPTTINLLKAGTWNTPWHGDFELTGDDLEEMASNFGEGVGLVVEDETKAPVNYGHLMGDKAAGWLKRIYVQAVDGSSALVGDVEWTPAAAQAIKEGEWRYISPEFNPRGWPWEDPEQEFTFVDNVLTGAALTNIPLFKKLKPITASRIPPGKAVKASQPVKSDNSNQQGERMNVEDLRIKEVKDLTDDEKKFLDEHKADLTDDERTKFGLEDDAAAKAEADKKAADEAAAEQAAKDEADAKAKADEEARAGGVEASAIAGRVTELEKQLKASRDENEALRTKIETKEVNDFLGDRIKAGQIKQDSRDGWAKTLLASRGDARTALQTQLEALPINEDIGNEAGDAGKDVQVNASDELNKRVTKIMADAREQGKTIAYSRARAQVLVDDENLKNQLKEEEN